MEQSGILVLEGRYWYLEKIILIEYVFSTSSTKNNRACTAAVTWRYHSITSTQTWCWCSSILFIISDRMDLTSMPLMELQQETEFTSTRPVLLASYSRQIINHFWVSNLYVLISVSFMATMSWGGTRGGRQFVLNIDDKYDKFTFPHIRRWTAAWGGEGTASDTAADNEISPAVRSLSDQSTHLSGSIETQIITRVTSVMRLSKAKLMTMWPKYSPGRRVTDRMWSITNKTGLTQSRGLYNPRFNNFARRHNISWELPPRHRHPTADCLVTCPGCSMLAVRGTMQHSPPRQADDRGSSFW